MKFISKIKQIVNYRKTASASFLTAFLMFLSTHFANAGWIWDVTAGSFFGWAAGAFAYGIGLLAGSAFWLVGLVVSLALNFNLHITESGNSIVRSGWDIMLNLTNLGFVLAIIVIAFATILQFENYAIKKTLWKLIVAALLVNFSLTISSAFIDVANNATEFMMEKSGASGTDAPLKWASAMAGMFQAQQLLVVDKNFDTNRAAGLAEGAFSTFMTIFASLIFGAVFTFIAAITMFTIAVLLFVRYVQLSFLLIFSPIIWLCWIFPATQTYWGMWWKRFLKWTFFAPIMMFFMYLALFTMKGTTKAYISVPNDFTSNAPITTPLAAVGQMFLVIGIMMGGLYSANAMSIEGAEKIIKTAQGANKGFIKGAYKYAGRQTAKVFGQPFAPGAPGSRRSRFNAWLGGNKITAPLAKWGKTAASYTSNTTSPYYKPGAHKGFFASTLGGAWSGAGFGIKPMKVWECQNCHNPKSRIQDKSKPDKDCPNCGVPAVPPAGSPPGTPSADWKSL